MSFKLKFLPSAPRRGYVRSPEKPSPCHSRAGGNPGETRLRNFIFILKQRVEDRKAFTEKTQALEDKIVSRITTELKDQKDKVTALLTERLNPRKSDEDRGFFSTTQS